MFPDPFKKMDEKMDKRFAELMDSIKSLSADIKKLNTTIEELTKVMKEFKQVTTA